MSERPTDEHLTWKAYPSWCQFTWLYLISLLAVLRGAVSVAFNVPGWETWIGGALALLACAALIRRWIYYVLTSRRVVLRNGYTGRDIRGLELEQIRAMSVSQGPIATLLGIGTVVIQAADGERLVRFRGVKDPDAVKARIQAMRPPPVALVEPSTDGRTTSTEQGA
jgi:uncharacterized membrane protein YdbT with pleckstrin-like domain